MAADHAKIRKLLEKTRHYDRDERFMATSDLKTELEMIQGEIDNDLQIPIRDAVLTQLDDGSNEVQGIAVSCLAAIALKFAQSSVSEIVKKLGKLLIDGKPELRDSYADGLKTIVLAVPDSFGDDIAHNTIVFLLRAIQEVDLEDVDRTNFSLDVLETLLQKFGSKFTDSHEGILNALYPLMHCENRNLRRRIPVTLGVLVNYLPDEQFKHLMDTVIGKIEKVDDDDDVLYTYIQCIGIVGRHAGVRIGKYLPKIVPLLVKFCNDEKEGRAHEEVIELREKCLQAFESLILQCPNDITVYVDDLIHVALAYISFDPNWQGEDMESKDDMEDDEDEGGWDMDDAGGDVDWGAGDDDAELAQGDDSWRVRRACVKTLAAFITTKSNILRDKYDELCEGFIVRFSDRDDDVKLEVFNATRNLVSATVLSGAPLELIRMPSLGPPPPLTRTVSLENNLEKHVGEMVTEIIKQLKQGEPKTQQGALSVIRELCIVRHGGLELWFPALFPCVIDCLQSSDTILRSKALDLIAIIFQFHEANFVHGYITSMAGGVISAVEDYTVRIKTQGMDVCALIAKAVRPDYQDYDSSLKSVIQRLYHVCFRQMSLVDIEQQVKVASLGAVADLIARFGDLIRSELGKTLDLLMQRLGNNVTRLAALMALTKICGSPLPIDITTIKTPALKEAVQYLRQQSPEIRREAANTLTALLKSSSGGLDKSVLPKLLSELAPHISDKDLFLTHLIFGVITAVITINPKVKLPSEIHDSMMTLLKSPLLQDSEALPTLITLFATLLRKAKSVTYSKLLEQLLACATSDSSPQSFSAIAQCVAGITWEASKSEQNSTVSRFIDDVDSKDDCVSQASLLCVGEIGRKKDLSNTTADKIVLKALSRKNEAVKQAASYSLGLLSAGNMDNYMPILLNSIKKRPDRRYLLLNALKENITYHSKDQERRKSLQAHTESILPLLLHHAKSKDEGIRTMVAECLGQLETVDCEQVFPDVERHLADPSPAVRETMVASVRFALEGDANVQRRIRTDAQRFFELVIDGEKGPDLGVRRQAFLTFNAILKHDASMVQYHIRKMDREDPEPRLITTVYEGTIFNPDLLIVQDLGAIKTRIDTGLSLRKAAFFAMDTLVKHAAYYIEISRFIEYLKNGLTDPNADIQLLTYQILTSIARNHGAELLNVVDSLPSALTTGIKSQLKVIKDDQADENVAQEANNVLRAAVKALDTINKIKGAESLGAYQRFFKAVLMTAKLKTMLKELHSAADEAVAGKS